MKITVSRVCTESVARGVARFSLLAALLVLATATTCRPTKGTRVESYPSLRITENSWLVANKLQVTGTPKTARVNGFLQVQVDAISRSIYDYQFEYRFRWLNEQGIEEEQGWAGFRQMFCTAKEPIHFQGVAPNTRVTDFEILIRFPDRVVEK